MVRKGSRSQLIDADVYEERSVCECKYNSVRRFWQTIPNTWVPLEDNPWICHRYLVRTPFVPPPPSLSSVKFLPLSISSVALFPSFSSHFVSAVCLPRWGNVPTESRELNMQQSSPQGEISPSNLIQFGEEYSCLEVLNRYHSDLIMF